MLKHQRIFAKGSILACFALLTTLVFTFSPLHHLSTAHAAVTVDCPPTQTEGDDNDWVEVIQYKLNSLEQNDVFSFSQYPLSTDGDFGSNTYGAVVTFQEDSGLSSTNGQVGTQTWSMMGLCNIDSAHVPSGYTYGGSYCPPQQVEGDDNIFVDALQHMINVAASYGWIYTTTPTSGWYPLATDGDFGSNTYNGAVNFQYSNGITDNGQVGPQTWGAMGMCYSPF